MPTYEISPSLQRSNETGTARSAEPRTRPRYWRRTAALMLLVLAIALAVLEAWRWLRPSSDPDKRTSAEQLAVEIANNMITLEGELSAFLLADGPEPGAVTARATAVRERFAWAHPLFLIDRDGKVLGLPASSPTGRVNDRRQKSRRRRFKNMIQRARSQDAITSGTGQARPASAGEPTARFTAAESPYGLRVLINLQRDQLWVTYRLRAAVLSHWLTAISTSPSGASNSSWRLLDPSGKIVYASLPNAAHLVARSTAPLATAPRWAVEVLSPAGGASRSWLRLGLASALLTVASMLFSGRRWWAARRAESSTPKIDQLPPANTEPAPGRISIGSTVIDLDRYEARRGEVRHLLTDREVALLKMFVAAPEQVIRRERILDEIWGYSAAVTSRTVDTFVYRLRQKIEADPRQPRHFLTVRGAGYRFVP